MSKSEEKAREYAKEYWKSAWELDEYSVDTLESISEEIYTAGYNQAVTDLSTENAQLREALRELVETTEELAYIIGQISRKQANTVTKAKTLIE